MGIRNALSSLGALAVDVVAEVLEVAIDVTECVATTILPDNSDVNIPGASIVRVVSEGFNVVTIGSEVFVRTVEGTLVRVADITSGAVLVHRDDQQPRRRGFRAAFKEQAGNVTRHFQGAVTDVTTQALGEEIGEATRLSLSTAGHTVTLGLSALQLRSAANPVNFVPLGPTFVRAVGARLIE